MITGDERPTCTACDKNTTAPPALLCLGCLRRLADNLRELAVGHARLDPRPGSSTSHGGRGAPGFGSRSPARDDVLVLTDRRDGATAEPARNARSVPACVAGWADRARESGVLAPRRVDGSWAVRALVPAWQRRRLALLARRSRRDVAAEVAALLDRLDAVARQWWVAEMAAEVEGLLWHVRRALDELEPTVPIGACPVITDDAVEIWNASWQLPDGASIREALACDGQIRARVFGEIARCRRCGACWRGMEQLRDLSRLLGDALLDLPGLSRYLGVPVSTLTTRAQREGWTKHGRRGRRLYSLRQARDSAFAAWDRKHPLHGCAPPPGWQRGASGWGIVGERAAA